MDIKKFVIEKYGMELPPAPTPGGIYSPVRQVGNLLYLSGQTPTINGVLEYKGKVDRDLSVEEGQKAARLCALNLIAVLNDYLDGHLERVKQIVQLVGFVRSSEDFAMQPQVINGASQVFFDVFGNDGLASRLAIGTNELPGGAPVEVLLTVEIK